MKHLILPLVKPMRHLVVGYPVNNDESICPIILFFKYVLNCNIIKQTDFNIFSCAASKIKNK